MWRPVGGPDGPDADEGGDTVRLTAALEKVPSDAFAQIWCDDVTGPTETCANCAAVRTTVLDALQWRPIEQKRARSVTCDVLDAPSYRGYPGRIAIGQQ